MASHAASDAAFGRTLVSLATAGFVYFTLWLLITPFQEADFLAFLFPSRYLALSIPALFLVTIIAIGGVFSGIVMMRGAGVGGGGDDSASSTVKNAATAGR